MHLSSVIPPHDRERMDRVVIELRENDLSCRTIAVIIGLYEGYDVSSRQVEGWTRRLGCPKRREPTSGSFRRKHVVATA